MKAKGPRGPLWAARKVLQEFQLQKPQPLLIIILAWGGSPSMPSWHPPSYQKNLDREGQDFRKILLNTLSSLLYLWLVVVVENIFLYLGPANLDSTVEVGFMGKIVSLLRDEIVRGEMTWHRPQTDLTLVSASTCPFFFAPRRKNIAKSYFWFDTRKAARETSAVLTTDSFLFNRVKQHFAKFFPQLKEASKTERLVRYIRY